MSARLRLLPTGWPRPAASPVQPHLALALASGALLGSLAWLAPPGAQAQNADSSAAGKGAQVYCFMRSNGNIHEVSWAAAYALIKRQSASLFKTSPEHAAVMITEAVVQNPASYPDCGRFLGDLYNRRIIYASPSAAGVSGSAGSSSTQIRSERFGN